MTTSYVRGAHNLIWFCKGEIPSLSWGIPCSVDGPDTYLALTRFLGLAYSRAVKRWHPDVCQDPDAVKRFLDVQAAYKELLNEKGSLETVGKDEWRAKWQTQVTSNAWVSTVKRIHTGRL